MVNARASILIERAPEPIFGFIADDFARNYKRWSPEVQRLEILTPGPLRVGTRARQVRVDQGRRTDTTFRVMALERPRQLCFVETRDRFRIEYLLDPVGNDPDGGPTRLTFCFQLSRLELYMRPFEKLIGSAVQEGATRVVGNIKGLVEAAVPAGGTRRASTL